MTREEARAKALDSGFPADQITDQVLALFGYEPPKPTEGLQLGPVIVPVQVQQELKDLDAEAKANNLPKNIAKSVIGVLSWARSVGIPLVLMFSVALSGCSTQKAQLAVQQMQISAQATSDQHLAFEERQIQYYRANEYARIEELYAAAMKSISKDVNGAEFVDVRAADVLMKQRLDRMAAVETNIREMRAQQALILTNNANVIAYSEGLKAYFKTQAINFEALKSSQDQLLQFLKDFVKEKK